MALDVLEIGVVVMMAIGILVWGPEKVPEIARTIGNARKQLDGYTKQLAGISKELQTSVNTGNFDNLGNVLTGAAAGPISGNPTTEEVAAATQGANTAATATASPSPPISGGAPTVVKSGDELLLEMAKQLRIPTQGKTRDEIQSEILARSSAPVESRYAAPPTPAETTPDSAPATDPTPSNEGTTTPAAA